MIETGEVAVRVESAPASHDLIALLAPEDQYLTMRDGCHSRPVTGTHSAFPFLPPGK